MQYRKFGNTALEVSEIGFGSWAIGGNAMIGETPIGWGKADDETSIKAIHAALDAGVSFFDTADIYGLGHSEELLGKELKNRNYVVIATKVGNVAREEKFTVDYSGDYIMNACEASLQRLQRDCIDYYQLHTARIEHLQNGECVEAMERLQQQGKIKYWGLSLNTFKPGPEAEYLMQRQLGSGFQLVFNILNQRSLDLIKKAASNGYGVIVRMPLQFGLLTGKFDEMSTFDKDDHRTFRLTKEVLEATLPALRQYVWPVAEREQVSKTALALSFILGIPEVTTVIPGIRTPGHVDQNTSSLKTLSKQTMDELFALAGNELKPVLDLIENKG
jgi:aryl-alcohol dehydrogenase-like predicted oxidoreductase